MHDRKHWRDRATARNTMYFSVKNLSHCCTYAKKGTLAAASSVCADVLWKGTKKYEQ
jgi:hypothetical protein